MYFWSALNPLKIRSWTRAKRALLSEIRSEMDRKGGKIGGKRSLETMTKAERVARAKKASAAAAKKRTEKRLAAEALKKVAKRK
jgi:hypothetical protein